MCLYKLERDKRLVWRLAHCATLMMHSAITAAYSGRSGCMNYSDLASIAIFKSNSTQSGITIPFCQYSTLRFLSVQSPLGLVRLVVHISQFLVNLHTTHLQLECSKLYRDYRKKKEDFCWLTQDHKQNKDDTHYLQKQNTKTLQVYCFIESVPDLTAP